MKYGINTTFFLDCVVSIGMVNQKQTKWFGTGFIVGRPINDDSGNKVYHTFLVTNRHVAEDKQSSAGDPIW
jgi:hypothetical protein